jgi:hypothetical protein
MRRRKPEGRRGGVANAFQFCEEPAELGND